MSLPIPISAPSSWPRRRIQAQFQMLGGGTPAKDVPEYWNGNVPWVSPKDMKTALISTTEDKISHTAVRASATQMVPAGCILIVVRSGILKHSIPVAIPQIDVALNQDMKALVPTAQCDTRFMRYIIHGHASLLLTLWRSLGATVESLDSERIKQSVFPVPPLSTQAAIANYLDEKTAAIDALIEKKRKLLDLLAEERAALINQAVTKGLDPSVPMKDSGIPWIGEIPAHWQVKRIKHLLAPRGDALRVGPFGSSLRSVDMQGDHTKVFNQRTVIADDFRDGDAFVSAEKAKELKAFTAKPGDLLLTTRGTIGRVAVVPEGVLPGIIHPCLMAIRADASMLSAAWLKKLLGLQSLALPQLQYLSNATTIDVIYSYNLREIALPVPPLDEQAIILDFLQCREPKWRTVHDSLREQIKRLQEYRQSLITAAVTGQLDIEAAA